MTLILASASEVRAQMLRAAGLAVQTCPARIDEDSIRAALAADRAPPRDIADALAETKARKIADRFPQALVLGCDQILALDQTLFAKPDTPDAARSQLRQLAGQTHRLYCAIVLYEAARPVWRHLAEARMTMHPLSDAFIDAYVTRNWESIRHSVGGYKIEEEGIRLFRTVEGDHHTILGLPLLPLLTYLHTRGIIAT